MKANHEQFFPVVLFIMVKVLDAIFAPMNIQNTESFHPQAQKVKTTLYAIINSTTGKYWKKAFLWMVTIQDFSHTQKLEPSCTAL